jgi:Flp pilus assembly pilin Flp
MKLHNLGNQHLIIKRLRQLKSRKGQTLVEYALILAFISVIAISVLISLGQQVKATYTKINSELSTASASH